MNCIYKHLYKFDLDDINVSVLDSINDRAIINIWLIDSIYQTFVDQRHIPGSVWKYLLLQGRTHE